jgi:hypothetical protein
MRKPPGNRWKKAGEQGFKSPRARHFLVANPLNQTLQLYLLNSSCADNRTKDSLNPKTFLLFHRSLAQFLVPILEIN